MRQTWFPVVVFLCIAVLLVVLEPSRRAPIPADGDEHARLVHAITAELSAAAALAKPDLRFLAEEETAAKPSPRTDWRPCWAGGWVIALTLEDLVRFNEADLRAVVAHELGHIWREESGFFDWRHSVEEKHESEFAADLYGAKLIGCRSMIEFLQRYAERGAAAGTHPTVADRILNIERNCPEANATR